MDTEHKLNLVVANYPITALKPFLYPLTTRATYPTLEDKNKLYKYILANKQQDELFNQGIYYEGTVLEKLIKLSKLDKASPEYKSLYADIISVGEYKIVPPQ